MAKVKAPLLSMRASGTIGKNIVFGAWRGVPYARQHVIPSNPQSAGQTSTRNTFKWLNDLYRHLGGQGIQPWDAAAAGRPFTGRNALIKSNLPQLRAAASLALLVGSPGVKGGPALDSFTPNTGAASGDIDFDFTIPELPAGWALNKVAGFAVIEQDPHDLGPVGYDEGSYVGANPQTFTLPDLIPATDYACVGWAVYVADGGAIAYSPSVTAIVTSGA